MKSRLFILLFLLFTTIVRAQDNLLPDLEPITVDNAAQLTQIARYGNGIFEYDAAWSPDGKTLAVAGSIGIWFYNTQDWNVPPTLIDLDKQVYQVAFSPDEKTIAYSTEDNVTYLVDAATHQQKLSFEHGSVFAFSPDGAFFAVEQVGYPDDCTDYCPPFWHVDVWKLAGHKKIATIDAPPLDYGNPQEIVFSPDGKLLTISWTGIEFNTCGNTQSEVQVWHMDQLPQSSEDQMPHTSISSSQNIVISPKSDLIAMEVNNYDGLNIGEIRLWDVQAGKERPLLIAGEGDYWVGIGTMHFNADGTKLTALIHDSTVDYLVTWDTTTGEKSKGFKFPMPVRGLIYSVDGSTLVSTTNNALRLWDTNKGYEQKLVRLEQSIVDTQFAPDGGAFVYTDAKQQLHLWTLDENGSREISISEPVINTGHVFWGGGKAVYRDENRLFVWDTASGEQDTIEDLAEEGGVAFSDNGLLIAYVAVDRQIHIWDTVNKKPLSILKFTFPKWGNFSFSPDSQQLLTTTHSDETDAPTAVQLWDTTGGTLIRDFGNYHKEYVAARFNQDGKLVMIQTSEQQPQEQGAEIKWLYQTAIFNPETNRQVFFDENKYAEGKLNPDWTLFMVNKGDWSSAAVDVIDVATKKPAFEQPIYSSYGGGIGGFSPDGKRMTMSEISQNGCGGDDRGMGLWDMTTGKRIGKIGLSSGRDGGGGGMDYSGDSSLIVVGDRYNVTLWDARTGENIGDLSQRDLPESYITFNEDGTRLITASSAGTIRLWGVPR